MKPPAIYADFNGIQGSSRSPERRVVPLDTMGSLMDLCRLGIVLSEGLVLTIHSDSDETEDLEATGTVFFDSDLQEWVAEIDPSQIRDVPMYDREENPSFPCVSCGAELSAQIKEEGLSLGDLCSECGKPIHLPLSPPVV